MHKQAGKCVFHVFTSNAHQNTAPQRIVGYPLGPSTKARTDVYIYISAILGFYVHKDNTVGIPLF